MNAPAVGDRIAYGDETRQVHGRLTYPEPPTPGTLVGPNGWGETCVVLATVDGVTLLGRAARPDVERAEAATAVTGPRSPFEHAAMRRAAR